MYAFNDNAKNTLDKLGVMRTTVPLELNGKEVHARDNENSEMVIYGHYPMMISAQCIKKTCGKCDKNSSLVKLKDRYGKYFPVKNNCTECYNTIYNTAPLILFPYRKELEKMGIHAYRISFTTEQGPQVKQILHLYEKIFLNWENSLQELYTGEYTGGHYKRGVE